jgi:mannose-6-phosphate isomerase-like protein (cupin superfamily)
MKTKMLPADYQHLSPAGAEVRLLINNSMAGAAHCTLTKGKISKPVAHRTVSEFWHVLSGRGQLWRRQGEVEQVAELAEGVTIDIPLGTDFQYRSNHEADLVFVCITMPPWPGSDEIRYLDEGVWIPTA